MPKDIFSIGDASAPQLNNKKYRHHWVEDSYSPDKSSPDYLSANVNFSRFTVLLVVALVCFGVLFFRTAYLQILQGANYRMASESNRIRIEDIKAPRGILLDRSGTKLTDNVPNFILTATPADLPADVSQKTALANKLASLVVNGVGDIPSLILNAPKDSYQPITLAEHLPYEQAMKLKVAASGLPGITLESTTFRDYLASQVFSPLLGYVGKVSDQDLKNHPDYAFDDYIGKSGLELYYEKDLRGQSGKKEIEVDSLGKESKVIAETKPESGTNLTLTIDSKLQEAVGKALNDTVKSSKNITGGAVVAIDPRNGEVLALVTSPTFDSNAFTLGLSADEYKKISSDPKQPLFNRPVSGQYPSGSTIKPLIALAGLQEGVITEHTTVMSTGGIQIGQWFFPDWKPGGHGVTDVKKALAESVNTFFYTIGGGNGSFVGLGVNRITSYLKLFGLGQPLGLDFPGEASGFLPSPEWKEKSKNEKWYIGDTYHYSIGQGDLLVTPLQVANYTATVANGGTLYKPHLVKSFIDPTGKVIKDVPPEIIRQNFLNQNNFQIVRAGLRQAVTSGSARALNDLPFAVAAKTGTAEFGDFGSTHAWLTAFAPYDNPEIAITVLVEAGGEGHAAALPIAKLGLQTWYNEHNSQ